MVGSIPVGMLMPLLAAIVTHMKCLGFRPKSSSANTTHRNRTTEQDELFSNTIQEFFVENNINPLKEYPEYYSNDRHTIAVSYVWSKTSLWTISGHF
jgi:hypothetical protein